VLYSIIRGDYSGWLWCVCCIMGWRPQSWFGTTCIYISCLGALDEVDMSHKCLCTWCEFVWIMCWMLLCTWWIIVIDESYTCWKLLVTIRWIREDVHVLMSIMNHEILWWLILHVILFDYVWCEAKPQWLFGWPPTCLYEWVDGVQD